MQPLSVVITGASSGVGKATAHYFLSQGHQVTINSSKEETLTASYQEFNAFTNIVAVAGDLRDPAVGQRLIDAAVEQFGAVDILVNTAGIFAPQPFLAVAEADLDLYLGVNFKSSFFTSQAAVRAMLSCGRGGSILNFSTALVEHAVGGFPATAAASSKGALHALSRQLATEFGKDNIRVNTLVLGVVRTPLLAKMGVMQADSLASLQLLQRVGELTEVAELIYSLTMNTFLTGATINLDGGHGAGHFIG